MEIPVARHVLTRDGSSTLYVERFDEHYHSIHGALQESMHVFIRNGLEYKLQTHSSISVLEVGFGTGLNALLTYLYSQHAHVHYTGIEAYPLSSDQLAWLNYPSMLEQEGVKEAFYQLHQLSWNEKHQIDFRFEFTKYEILLQDYQPAQLFDLIYFDAFAPDSQPELWTLDIFRQMFRNCEHDGILVTYSAKGNVRRAMISAGFQVEKLPGPPGKREMIRAVK